MLIYKAQNKVNGKCYIGQTTGNFNKRQGEHLSAARRSKKDYFHNALRKYGEENFTWEILHDNISNIKTLNNLEKIYIHVHDAFWNGYNLTTGGENYIRSKGRKLSEEHKKKLHGSRIGKKLSQEHRKILIRSNKTRVVSEETKIRMSEAQKNSKRCQESRKKLHESFRGKPLSEEHKKKIGESLKGRECRLETRRKISEAQKGKKNHAYKHIPIKDILKYKNEGFTQAEVAKMLGCNKLTIREKLKKEGLSWQQLR